LRQGSCRGAVHRARLSGRHKWRPYNEFAPQGHLGKNGK